MASVTLAELREPKDLFDRAAVMPRPVRKHPHGPHHELEIEQRAVAASLHPQLPVTPAWTYDGRLPGPVVVVDAEKRVRVIQDNDIAGTLPYRHVVVDDGPSGVAMNDAGSDGTSTDPVDAEEAAHAAALHAWTVVHLHGAPTAPDSDGWPDNVIGTGAKRRDEYQFARETWPMTAANGSGTATFRSGAAPMYWYHDHGMGVTRLNVYAGLAGAWLVRDPLEHQLGLPVDQEHEIPLVIADRNLDTVDGTAGAALDGRMLHKVQVGVREAFAPVTVVNGLIWPRCTVDRRVHRLRILNGSNARTYRLHFHALRHADEHPGEAVPAAAVQQIGTDGGLLGAAVDLPDNGLVLSPGERADVLVDFGLLADDVHHVVVWNSALAPFNGTAPAAPIGTPDDSGFLPIPHVMRFDLTGTDRCPGLTHGPIAGMALDPEFRRVPTDHGSLPAEHGHTLVALLEEEVIQRDGHGDPRRDPVTNEIIAHPMLFVHEMVPAEVANRSGCNLFLQQVESVDPADRTRLTTAPAGIELTLPDKPTRYVTAGKRFNDGTMTLATQGAWHQWKIINLSPDTHPFHIHLSQFQPISRDELTPAPADPNTPRSVQFVGSTPGVLDDNEQGWKDTFRVNPGGRDPADNVLTAEMVTVVGCFAAHAGRYVYHCHILEHEDTEMMRQFVVLPAELMAFMSDHKH